MKLNNWALAYKSCQTMNLNFTWIYFQWHDLYQEMYNLYNKDILCVMYNCLVDFCGVLIYYNKKNSLNEWIYILYHWSQQLTIGLTMKNNYIVNDVGFVFEEWR